MAAGTLRLLRLAGLVGVAVLGGGCRDTAPPGAPHVVLITLESLRTDHVGAYGGRSPARPDVPVTPAIDAFAEGATLYEDAHTVTSWTLASHASLFTGLYPTGHQTDGPRDRLDGSYPTLAEALADHGYQTAGFVSGPYLRRTHNLHQGFEHWDDSIASITSGLAHDDVTNPRMEAALRDFLQSARDPERPLFLFAYFWDPHFDFLPPPPYDRLFVPPDAERVDVRSFDTNEAIHADMPPAQLAYLLSQYAGELRWTDLHVGRVFEMLRERGLWDDALIVVTADHGEEFFDHGAKGHKNNLYAETTRVPLIVKYPGQQTGRRDTAVVSLVDLAPTILSLAGVEVEFPLHGRSLLDPPSDRAIFYELLELHYFEDDEGRRSTRSRRWNAVREGDWKLVWSEGAPGSNDSAELFDVHADPRETLDLADGAKGRRAALERRFVDGMERARRDAEGYERGGPADLTPAEIEELEALGYLR
ncbi:MAG: sulfatase [Myxococcota bacterium]|nr:sulfatase [Myxococcota bacterium]